MGSLSCARRRCVSVERFPHRQLALLSIKIAIRCFNAREVRGARCCGLIGQVAMQKPQPQLHPSGRPSRHAFSPLAALVSKSAAQPRAPPNVQSGLLFLRRLSKPRQPARTTQFVKHSASFSGSGRATRSNTVVLYHSGTSISTPVLTGPKALGPGLRHELARLFAEVLRAGFVQYHSFTSFCSLSSAAGLSGSL